MAIPLEFGQLVQVMVYAGDRTVPCEAMVMDLAEGSFTIDHPHRHNVKIPVRTAHLMVTLTTPEAAYLMDCPLLETLPGGLVLGLPDEKDVQKVQRRQFVRVPTAIACSFYLDDNPGTLMAGLLQDLSNGGCSFSSPVAMLKGQRLMLSFKIPDEGSFKLTGIVRRSIATMNHGRVQHSIGFEFGELEESNRKRIVRFVHSVQANMLNNKT